MIKITNLSQKVRHVLTTLRVTLKKTTALSYDDFTELKGRG